MFVIDAMLQEYFITAALMMNTTAAIATDKTIAIISAEDALADAVIIQPYLALTIVWTTQDNYLIIATLATTIPAILATAINKKQTADLKLLF